MNIVCCCDVTYDFVNTFYWLQNFDRIINFLFNNNSHKFITKLLYNPLLTNLEHSIAHFALTASTILMNWSHPCTECRHCMEVFQKGFFDYALAVLHRRM